MAKTLIVDHEADLTEALAKFPERFGHDCLTALDVRQAIDAVAQHRPELVITALRLPDGDGFDVVGHIRQTLPQTPTILMTAYYVPGTEEARAEPALRPTCASPLPSLPWRRCSRT